jgi:hypothetical protein
MKRTSNEGMAISYHLHSTRAGNSRLDQNQLSRRIVHPVAAMLKAMIRRTTVTVAAILRLKASPVAQSTRISARRTSTAPAIRIMTLFLDTVKGWCAQYTLHGSVL